MIEKRMEQKYLMNRAKCSKFLLDNKKQLIPIYEEREVKSLYFDTHDFNLYFDSLNKDYDKFKIRFRTYNNSDVISKEIKFSANTGKYKITKPTSYKSLSSIPNFYYRNIRLQPSLEVKYKRNYYEFRGNRLTVDSNILFSKPKNDNLQYELQDLYVFELKNLDASKNQFFSTNPIFHSVTFSKYEEGIKKIYKF